MLRSWRSAAVAATSLALVAVSAVPALARDPYAFTTCAQNPHPGCELGAGQGAEPAAPPRQETPQAPDRGTPSPDGGRRTRPPGDTSLDPSELARCSYVRSAFQPPSDATQPVLFQTVPHRDGPRIVTALGHPGGLRVQLAATVPDGQPGAWYVYQCQTQGVRDALYRPPVWIADGQGGPADAAPDPVALAEQARNQLHLRGPAIGLSPTGRQLIRLPTWMWLDPAGWNPASATAAAGGVSVTATAMPVGVVWTMGDGSEVRCAGPGTPYRADADPKASSPDCGHTYQHVSEDQPGGTFPVTATVTWNVTWAGAGQTGAFEGLTTVSTVQVEVISIPALITGGG